MMSPSPIKKMVTETMQNVAFKEQVPSSPTIMSSLRYRPLFPFKVHYSLVPFFIVQLSVFISVKIVWYLRTGSQHNVSL